MFENISKKTSHYYKSINIILFTVLVVFLISSCESYSSKKDLKKSTFQDFGFEYFYKYDSDILVGTYAIAFKDSLLYSYASLENGVAFQNEKTTPKYGIPDGMYISLDVYKLKESIDSIKKYDKILKYKLKDENIISDKFDTEVMELKFEGKKNLIFGSSVQNENNSNLYEKNLGKVKTSRAIRKLLSRTDL